MTSSTEPLRILAVSATWEGANDYAFVRAFRRAGHSVSIVPIEDHLPRAWRSRSLRLLRRALLRHLVRGYNQALRATAQRLRPDLFFVFKGDYVAPATLDALRDAGCISINFYPDTGFSDHGPWLPRAISRYDWVFTTKTAGVDDLARNYAQPRASFVPHAFDPEVHRPWPMSASDHALYDCDLSFIGNWSSKKGATMAAACTRLADLDIRIWGAARWRGEGGGAGQRFQGRGTFGAEYAKAILGSRINLGLLFEGGPSAPRGDLITARTFEIPATGGFMLHERNEEVEEYFTDGIDCAMFGNLDELVDKTRYYLTHRDERERIAAAGRALVHNAGFAVDERVRLVLDKYAEIRSARA
ncbi:MAG: glycosyltransferase [Gammaproteobacteria bacterium]